MRNVWKEDSRTLRREEGDLTYIEETSNSSNSNSRRSWMGRSVWSLALLLVFVIFPSSNISRSSSSVSSRIIVEAYTSRRNHNNMLASRWIASWSRRHGCRASAASWQGWSSSSSSSSSSSTLLRSSRIPSNEELVKVRLSTAKAKKEARAAALQNDYERNLQLKRRMMEDRSQQELYAVKVSVCKTLRKELNMNGREKRGRVFIDKAINNQTSTAPYSTMKGLKYQIHAFFRSLKKSTYILSASLPLAVNDDGSIVAANEEQQETYDGFVPLETDDDVARIFANADEYFEQCKDKLKRPAFLLHVKKDPNAPPPPPTPYYLKNMSDPTQSSTMTMLSFYAFPPSQIQNPEQFALTLKSLWKPFKALGRVYVATEGINAQMSVPTNILDNFMECCRSIPELGVHMENGINIDPIPLTLEQFAVAGDMDGKPAPPFKNLHIRVRNQVVADGLDKPLDWQNAGYDMPPMEWHEILKKTKQQDGSNNNSNTTTTTTKASEQPILLDCRNTYETTVGRFDGAEPLDTTNFRDSWEVLQDRLKDTPKDAPIMTYCTGGIRCVKVGAYLTQELGFKNVSRLAGGIIAYDRTLNDFNNNSENGPTAEAIAVDEEEKSMTSIGEESMFKGTNYVFDGRVGRQITNDALGECITCGAKTNLISNCKNSNCHKRMVQCEKCHTHYHGTCSEECKHRVINSDNNSNSLTSIELTTGDKNTNGQKPDDDNHVKYESLDDYSAGYSTSPPYLFKEIELNTAHYMPTGSHMVSGASQGRLLTTLASMTRSGRILELGTFTGYATASLLEGASLAGEYIGTQTVGNRNKGPFVMTLERDQRAVNIARAHIQIMSTHGTGIDAAEHASRLRSDNSLLEEELTEDSFTYSYRNAGCEICRVNDALAVVETMASSIQQTNDGEMMMMEPFDIVFVDADKTRLLDYVEACLNSDNLLKKGGLIIVDNVLWKGLVLDVGDFSNTHKIFNDDGLIASNQELKKSRRARKLATLMHKFNSAMVKDDRVEVVLLPIRDGLSVLRKR